MNESNHPIRVSTVQTMLALLAKDWRLFRAPMIALIVVGATVYLIAIIALLYPQQNNSYRQDAADLFFNAAIISFELTGVFAAALGGVAIAGERSDRTADFVGLLPVKRYQIVLSKWLVALIMLFASVFIHLAVAGICTMLEPRSFFQSTSQPQHVQQIMNDEGIAGGMWVCSTLSLFGIAWMLSTFLRSGPISACVSIGATIAIISITAIYLDSYGSADKWGPVIFCFVTFSAGMTCLLGGTIYYLRRVAP